MNTKNRFKEVSKRVLPLVMAGFVSSIYAGGPDVGPTDELFVKMGAGVGIQNYTYAVPTIHVFDRQTGATQMDTLTNLDASTFLASSVETDLGIGWEHVFTNDAIFGFQALVTRLNNDYRMTRVFGEGTGFLLRQSFRFANRVNGSLSVLLGGQIVDKVRAIFSIGYSFGSYRVTGTATSQDVDNTNDIIIIGPYKKTVDVNGPHAGLSLEYAFTQYVSAYTALNVDYYTQLKHIDAGLEPFRGSAAPVFINQLGAGARFSVWTGSAIFGLKFTLPLPDMIPMRSQKDHDYSRGQMRRSMSSRDNFSAKQNDGLDYLQGRSVATTPSTSQQPHQSTHHAAAPTRHADKPLGLKRFF